MRPMRIEDGRVIKTFCWFQAAFDDIALFFYDIYGGSYIGVVWKPSATAAQSQIKVYICPPVFDPSLPYSLPYLRGGQVVTPAQR